MQLLRGQSEHDTFWKELTCHLQSELIDDLFTLYLDGNTLLIDPSDFSEQIDYQYAEWEYYRNYDPVPKLVYNPGGIPCSPSSY